MAGSLTLPRHRSETGSQPINRMRWATQRVTGKHGANKRESILSRLHHRHANSEKGNSIPDGMQNDGSTVDGSESVDDETPRRVYVNLELPSDEKDETGQPKAEFARNKIRTAKYTPLSFLPKNLWYQFHNVANIYFLFVIILAFFSIFGASNPGLGSVPLIFILTVTAIKDAVEDYRRTVLDNQLNNSPVHRLTGWTNVNVREDDVSTWRRMKKATSHALRDGLSFWKRRKHTNKGSTGIEGVSDDNRQSIETPRHSRPSMASVRRSGATSFYSTRSNPDEAIPLTSVTSPTPRVSPQLGDDLSADARPTTAFSFEDRQVGTDVQEIVLPSQPKKAVPVKAFGSVIDPTREGTGNARFKKQHWKDVKVGDFVRIYNEEQIPADIVILATSDPDGACYVETKNLDGETNLKVRQALRCSRGLARPRECEKAAFYMESEPPHANLYSYSGVARWTQKDKRRPEIEGLPMAEPININNLLLRGCSLRNTAWILGVVMFTGRETKIMINSGVTPSKRSRISRELNWNVVYNFIILFIMCLISGIVQGVTWGQGHNSLDFFEFGSIGGKPAIDGLVTFWSAVILFQNLVPISLYISLEIIKTCQAFFIYSDVNMYYDKIDYPCTPKSWNISDDLGQIEYIFSDKTGTLTQNVMEFKKCTINGVPYGEAYTEAQAGIQRRQGIDVETEGAKAREQISRDRAIMLKDLKAMHENVYLHDEDLTFVAPDFVHDLRGDSGDVQAKANAEFMLALALCHTVITEKVPGTPPKIEFKAQSPDEAALVATARDCGFSMLGRSNTGLILNTHGEQKEYEILNTLEFNSTRKRMSAIMRMPEDGRIVLFCKGADSMIYSRLAPNQQQELRKSTGEHLELFAREGLRTLCIAKRDLTEEQYEEWSREHDLAAAAVSEREEKLERVSDLIERDLTLIGGTAIEDRLQDGVPDTIALLGQAGIKLWVLTGDKVETAINIGFSCNLLDNSMDLIIFNLEPDDMQTAEDEVMKHLGTFGLTGSHDELIAARSNHEPPDPTHAIVVDGEALKLLLSSAIRQRFLLLCKQCKSVLCCRVSPAQKAEVVDLVKTGLDVMTLSVGDGANDVAMIQKADVGVGIAGEEGRQAVMSSDFAIGQFRFLQRLLLVHGRWSYRRLAETIANFFYKNIVWVFALFWYQLYNNFDVSYLFDYAYVLLYNVAYTSLPIILLGILDQDVNDVVSLAVPQLYRGGIERREWTQTKFWVYMVDAFYQSLMCFYITYLLFSPGRFVTGDGYDVNDGPRIGIYVACATIAVVNSYVLMNTYRWDWLICLIVLISILLIWFWTGVYSSFKTSQTFYRGAAQVYGQLSFWAVTLLTVIVCLLPRFTAKAIQKIYFPYDVDIIRENVRLGAFDHLQTQPRQTSATSSSTSNSSDGADNSKKVHKGGRLDDEERPIYPPSVTATATTGGHHTSQHGSDGSDYLKRHPSAERPYSPPLEPPPRTSMERPRPSFDRLRSSMDRMRPSFEASGEITSSAMLTRLESSHSIGRQQYHAKQSSGRTQDVTSQLQ